MKAITFKNRFNGERVVCNDPKAVQVIDGIEYLLVSKTVQDRKFLMRKEALEKIKAQINGVSSVVVAQLSVKQLDRVRFPLSPQLNCQRDLEVREVL